MFTRLISTSLKNFFSDGLTDCEDPECCESPVCQKSQLCHTVPQPIDILLRKQPPAMTASFFEQMKFIIEDKGLQSYVQRAGFNERYFTVLFPKTTSLVIVTLLLTAGSNSIKSTAFTISCRNCNKFDLSIDLS